jgi:recombination protein RecA
VVKNKVAPPFKEAEFDIIYGEGISKVGEVCDLAVQMDLIEKGGAWFTVGETRIQGREAVLQYLKDHPEVCEDLEGRIKEEMAKKPLSAKPKAAAKPAGKAAGKAIDVSADDFDG